MTIAPPGGASSRIEVRVPAGREAPARAREALRPLAERVGDECLSTLELVVSELVTNAVRHSGAHAGDPITVTVRCGEDRIRVSVVDPGHGFPRPAGPPGPGAIGGWGLYLVAEVAKRWWVEPAPDGTRVVAELKGSG
jgi:anti-sigma regulatory factor (Ser/Thr protein kinase)